MVHSPEQHSALLVQAALGATQQMPTSGTLAAAARISIEFRADSMIGILAAPSGRRTIVYLIAPRAERRLIKRIQRLPVRVR